MRNAETPRARWVYPLFVLSGLGGLVFEVVFLRQLVWLFGSSAVASALVLAAFMTGLALGAAWVGQLADGIARPLRLYGLLELGAAVSGALLILLLGQGRELFLAPLRAIDSPALQRPLEFVFAFTLLLIPTFFMGGTLPALGRYVIRDLDRFTNSLGILYGANTLGASAGVFLAGFFAFEHLGVSRSGYTAALLLAGVGSVALSLDALESRRERERKAASRDPGRVGQDPADAARRKPPRNGLRQACFAAAGIGGLAVLGYEIAWTRLLSLFMRSFSYSFSLMLALFLIGLALGAAAVAILGPRLRQPAQWLGWIQLAMGGYVALSLLWLPERLAPVAGTSFTGFLLAAIVSHPELDSITGVELSDGVLGGLSRFEAENGGAWRDPRVKLLLEDGRHHLELTSETYDVISLEPAPPIVAGSVHLYTLDFYELCRRHTHPGGVVAQWLPLHAQSLVSARMTARTFVEAFPHVMLWLPSVRDAVLIGSATPLRLDTRRLEMAYAEPRTRANLERAFFETPASLLSTYLLDRSKIAEWAGDAPLITDEHPLMEFFRHQGGNMRDRDIGSLIAIPQADWSWLDVGTAGSAMRDFLWQENRALRAYVRSAVERDPSAGVEAARRALSTDFFLYPHGCTNRQLQRIDDGAHALRPAEAAAHRERCRRLRSVSRETDGSLR